MLFVNDCWRIIAVQLRMLVMLAHMLVFCSIRLWRKTISGQQRSYVARSVAMQPEGNLVGVAVALE